MTFRQNHLLNDDGSCRVHTFSVPVEGTPPSRKCAHCDEPQRYTPPTGGGRDPFVMVDEADLQALLNGYRDFVIGGAEELALIDRVENLLPKGLTSA